jgi:hypothetical protein
MHVVPSGKVPAFGRGRILTVEQGISEYTECVERARYVVVLGGYGGLSGSAISPLEPAALCCRSPIPVAMRAFFTIRYITAIPMNARR